MDDEIIILKGVKFVGIKFPESNKEWGSMTSYAMCLPIPNKIIRLSKCKKKRVRKKYEKIMDAYVIVEKFSN